MATTRNKSTNKSSSTPATQAIAEGYPAMPSKPHLAIAARLLKDIQDATPLSRSLHLSHAFAVLGMEEPTILMNKLAYLFLQNDLHKESRCERESRTYQLEKLLGNFFDLRHLFSPFRNKEEQDNKDPNQRNWQSACCNLVSAACLLCSEMIHTLRNQCDIAHGCDAEAYALLDYVSAQLMALESCSA